jgi:LPXTG-site transpeptidase (sortase) family protein
MWLRRMKKIVQAVAWLVRAAQKALTKKWAYLAVFFIVFIVSIALLGALDLLPEPEPPKLVAEAPIVSAAETEVAEEPTRIEIPKVGVKVSVANPTSTDVKVLDTALLKGAVRYPSSSNLGEAGNVIIFGHSSYLPVVHNPAFKAFDGIQDLSKDDEIMVYGTDRVYIYAVDTVAKMDANAAAIPLAVEGKLLTLATCDSFGTKSSRFVVTAHLVGSNPLGA